MNCLVPIKEKGGKEEEREGGKRKGGDLRL